MTDGEVAHAGPEELEVGRLGCDHPGELGGEALGLAELASAEIVGRGEVAEAPALGHPVGPAILIVQGMSARLAPGVVGQHGAGDPLGPARLAVLGAVRDVDHAEQVAASGGPVDGDQ